MLLRKTYFPDIMHREERYALFNFSSFDLVSCFLSMSSLHVYTYSDETMIKL